MDKGNQRFNQQRECTEGGIMVEELEFLRDQNVSLQARIAGLEHEIDQMRRKHSETYELNDILQNRLRETGLSPYLSARDLEPKPERQSAIAAETKPAPLTTNMIDVLRGLLDGTSIDHGRTITPRERAGRGRTLDKLKERGLLDSSYQPTDQARSLMASF